MNIYISNLSHGIDDTDLRQLFSEYGEISSAKVIMDRDSGRSRGFGFVEMVSDEDGNKAIKELNEAEYDGRVINVTVAKPRAPRTNNNNSRGNYNSGRRFQY